MLFVVYNYNFIIKFVLILPVFYYYVTPNVFLQSTYFWLTLYITPKNGPKLQTDNLP